VALVALLLMWPSVDLGLNVPLCTVGAQTPTQSAFPVRELCLSARVLGPLPFCKHNVQMSHRNSGRPCTSHTRHNLASRLSVGYTRRPRSCTYTLEFRPTPTRLGRREYGEAVLFSLNQGLEGGKREGRLPSAPLRLTIAASVSRIAVW